jgi:hypothetical protein
VVDGGEAVKARAAGVEMIVSPDQWPEPSDVRNRVTPLKVRIENTSDEPLSIRYDHFSLIGPQGEHFACLPLYLVEGATRDPAVMNKRPPVDNPQFEYSGFEVSPYYSPAFPGIPRYKGTYLYDPHYNKTYYRYWTKVNLPNEDMYVWALPEGVLNPGGSMSGFLFFENIPESAPRVTFRADLMNAESGDIFGAISAPFSVYVAQDDAR